MRSVLAVCVVACCLLAPVAAFAGDVVGMPTGNMVGPHKAEFNYIYLSFDPPEGVIAPDHMNVYETFVGVGEHIELDVDVFSVSHLKQEEILNAYVKCIEETPNRPSFIVGAYNLLSDSFMGKSEFSPFFVSAYNLMAPEGPPSFSDPLVRGHLGWGTGFHEEKFFGGVQFLVHPNFGGAVYNYRGDMAYIAVVKPWVDWIELRGGTLAGDAWGCFGLFFDW